MAAMTTEAAAVAAAAAAAAEAAAASPTAGRGRRRSKERARRRRVARPRLDDRQEGRRRRWRRRRPRRRSTPQPALALRVIMCVIVDGVIDCRRHPKTASCRGGTVRSRTDLQAGLAALACRVRRRGNQLRCFPRRALGRVRFRTLPLRAEHCQLLWAAVTSHVHSLRLRLMDPTITLPDGLTRSATCTHRGGTVTSEQTVGPDCASWPSRRPWSAKRPGRGARSTPAAERFGR